ncbi:hypothetical protein IPG36_06235 [bacterium]|nr:MAG: hypothetical protein IPG36_06235 [bacterium]
MLEIGQYLVKELDTENENVLRGKALRDSTSGLKLITIGLWFLEASLGLAWIFRPYDSHRADLSFLHAVVAIMSGSG